MVKMRLFPLLWAALLLGACEHTVRTETTVHPDGSLDKVITFEGKDSVRNLFGLQEGNGWIRQTDRKKDSAGKEKDVWVVRYEKHFASTEEANRALASQSDTLFSVSATFEKRFRWFYTYIRYAETFHALNRMQLPADDYLVPEDYAFIDRLPAEGKPISKADQFFLDKLQSRIYDDYGTRAYFEEYYDLHVALLSGQGMEQRWLDTLAAHKEHFFELTQRKDIADDFLLDAIDSVGVPLKREAMALPYAAAMKQFEAKLNFITSASDGKYHNRINLPWTVVNTNADSVAGNALFWSPPSIKFLLNDYTMYGECRQMNLWAVLISVGFVAVTMWLLFRKRS